MKRIYLIAVAALVVGGVVYAAPDVEPVRSIYQQFQYKAAQHFEKEANFAFIDAGQFATVKTSYLDAGSGHINGNLGVIGTLKAETVDAGAVNVQGVLGINRAIHCGADLACGTVALSSGTPSTATKTVESGATCVCWPVGTTAAIAAGGCAANVSSTTATFTGPNSVTTTVAWMCFK